MIVWPLRRTPLVSRPVPVVLLDGWRRTPQPLVTQPPGTVDTTDVVRGAELCTAARPPCTPRSSPLDGTCSCRGGRTATPDQHAEGGRGSFSRWEAGDPPHTPDDQEWRAPCALGTERGGDGLHQHRRVRALGRAEQGRAHLRCRHDRAGI